MKHMINTCIIALMTFVATAQTNSNQLTNIDISDKVGIFQFETEIIDYGSIRKNTDGKRVFKFKNVGKQPIIISKVKASCGCTVPTKPKQPIMPGEMGEIGVKYDTKRIGSFSKTITITSNASKKITQIHIKGTVLKTEVSNTQQVTL